MIRKAAAKDALALKTLYFEHLTKSPPEEPQDMALWEEKLSRMEADENYHLLVYELNGVIVSSVTLIILENLTHGLRPYGVMENVVTHTGYRGQGYASALIQYAAEIAKRRGCYKIMLMTGSKKESTLRFYRQNGFLLDAKTACLMHL